MNGPSIICDTNIWYSDTLNDIDTQASLYATLINLLELCRTPNNLDRMDVTRVACQQILQRNRGIYVYSPTKHLAVVSGVIPDDGNDDQLRECLDLISAIADGADFDPDKRDAFVQRIGLHQEHASSLAAQLNGVVDAVRAMGIKKNDPLRYTDINSTKGLIASQVGIAAKCEVAVDDIDWKEAELLLHTMHWLHLDLEVSKRRWQPNDVNDLYNLAYVGKGKQYWTLEQRWNKVIEQAGMGHYLYRPA